MLDLHLFVPLDRELRTELENFALDPQLIDAGYAHLLDILSVWNMGAPDQTFLLKMPFHFMFFNRLHRMLAPETKFVFLYRDPGDVFLSWIHLRQAFLKTFYIDESPSQTAAALMSGAFDCLVRKTALNSDLWDASITDHKVVFLGYEQLLADPIGCVRSIYQRIGWDLFPEIEELMRTYLAENPQHKHGSSPKLLAEELGIDGQALMEKCRDVMQLFQNK